MRTTDVACLERFYAGHLGLPVVRRDAARGSVWIAAGGVVLMIERLRDGEPPVPAASMELLAFAVEEGQTLQGWRARLAQSGVEVEGSTEHTLYFRDPDGRRVGVSAYAF